MEKVTNYMVERLPKTSTTDIIFISKKNVSIMGDPVLLSWAFENIIKNSIDAIDKEKGEISIKIDANIDFVIISFVDNGKGIKRNNWSNIFKPGFSTKKRGWGLGLSLAQRIVTEIHKGDIMIIDSTVDGTEMQIKLNLAK